jgi:hypothetical protein
LATVLKTVLAGLAGVMIGLLVTISSLDLKVHGSLAGPWRGAPRDGAPDADSYSLAAVARAGLLPLGAAEGLSFVAAVDSSGGPLLTNCDYVVGGTIPAARFWTLSVLTPDGLPIANPAHRSGFTSAEVLRVEQAPVSINVSQHARDGNWLPVGDASRFVLAFRLYDTSLSASTSHLTADLMPTVAKQTCR